MHSYNNENKKGKGEQLVSCNGAFALINSFYLFDNREFITLTGEFF